MRLTMLGSGDAFSGSGCSAATVLDGRVLVDGGAPTQVLLPRAGLSIHDIELILVTHFHADHTFMLPGLLGARAVSAGDSRRPLTIAGPVGTREYLRRLVTTGFGQKFQEVVDREVGPEFLVLQDGKELELLGFRIRSHSVVHSTGPSLAYAVSGDGISIGFSGDTTLCAGLIRLAASVDALVCECSGMDGPVEGGHLCRAEVERLIAEHPDTRFILNHLPRREPVAGALIAHDLLTLELTPTAGRATPAA